MEQCINYSSVTSQTSQHVMLQALAPIMLLTISSLSLNSCMTVRDIRSNRAQIIHITKAYSVITQDTGYNAVISSSEGALLQLGVITTGIAIAKLTTFASRNLKNNKLPRQAALQCPYLAGDTERGGDLEVLRGGDLLPLRAGVTDLDLDLEADLHFMTTTVT